MGIVFLLLGVLAVVIGGLVRLDRPRAREPKAAKVVSAGSPGALAGPDPALLAAIMIAVRAHIRVRRKQAAPAMRSHQPGTLPRRWVASGRTRQNRSWAPRGRYV
jgi:Na+-transporting methylmalonyl-CoA/oxaloacetate decarboxylase gamma subunit